MKEKHKKKKKMNIKYLLLALSIIAVAIIVYLVLVEYGNYNAFTYWGGFIGGSLGGIATVIAFLLTSKQNRKENEENRKLQIMVLEYNLEKERLEKKYDKIENSLKSILNKIYPMDIYYDIIMSNTSSKLDIDIIIKKIIQSIKIVRLEVSFMESDLFFEKDSILFDKLDSFNSSFLELYNETLECMSNIDNLRKKDSAILYDIKTEFEKLDSTYFLSLIEKAEDLLKSLRKSINNSLKKLESLR